jgi:hypothetical protein
MGLDVHAPAAIAKSSVDLLVVANTYRDDIRAQLASMGGCAARVVFPNVSVSVAEVRRQIGGAFGQPGFLEGADGV